MMIGFLSLSIPTVMGQVATSLYFMDNLPQSSILNPAFDPNYNFYFGLPIINNTNVSFTSDITLDDIYNDGDYFWNSVEGYDDFVNNLHETSFFSGEVNSGVFNLGFAVGESGYFHFGLTNRADFTIGVPQDFFRLNDLTINHDLSGFEMEAKWFNEYAFGYSHVVNEKLIVGAKVKFLGGVAAASSRFDEFDFSTGTEMWGINIDGAVNISAPVDTENDENGYPEEAELEFELGVTEMVKYTFEGYGNPGFGVDLGVEYEIVPKLKLSASIIDLGKIYWKRDLTNYNANGKYDFKGLENLITTEGDEAIGIDDDVFENLADTIQNSIQLTETSNTFTTTLSPKVFVGAEYELTKALSLGVLYKARFIRESVRQNVYFNANANFKNMLTLGVNYNYGINSQNSFGGVLGLRLAPFYIYLAADVLPGYARGGTKYILPDGEVQEFPLTFPGDLSAANLQFGINITLGEKRRLAKKAQKSTPNLLKSDIENSSVYYPF